MQHCRVTTVVGELTLVANEHALTGLHWPGQAVRAHFADPGEAVHIADHPLLHRAHAELLEYLAGERRAFEVPIAPQGSEFDVAVWRRLLEVPYGSTVTYGDIADGFGKRGLSQRVGQSVGGNPIGIVIPCHRVLGSDGSLTGFAGGLERKRWLLQLEEPAAADAGRLF